MYTLAKEIYNGVLSMNKISIYNFTKKNWISLFIVLVFALTPTLVLSFFPESQSMFIIFMLFIIEFSLYFYFHEPVTTHDIKNHQIHKLQNIKDKFENNGFTNIAKSPLL